LKGSSGFKADDINYVRCILCEKYNEVGFQKMQGISSPAATIIASQERVQSMGLVG